VEFFTLSKSYNMPGWRVGFMVGNTVLVARWADQELLRLRDVYADPGGVDCCARRAAGVRQRRFARTIASGAMCWSGAEQAGLACAKPEGDDVCVGARFRSSTRRWGRWSFQEAAAGGEGGGEPGVGFGEYGDGHVRFSLIENEERTRQALRGIKGMFGKG
jgi:alanine-synthesizing transaminase